MLTGCITELEEALQAAAAVLGALHDKHDMAIPLNINEQSPSALCLTTRESTTRIYLL
jgi:hypothetical protein